ncbi:hypothetical protein D3C73_911150 [compost metagenome]
MAQIGQKNGYEEVDRELELYEGRNQIGDIGLVLKNNDDHFILIEAKNHALPLNVYFKDFEAVSTRLKYLQGDWEKKVNKRISQLSSKHTAIWFFHYVKLSFEAKTRLHCSVGNRYIYS